MYTLIKNGDLTPSAGGTITFPGGPYGSGVSFFLVNNLPGQGPVMHRHPYSETWIMRSGKARFTVGDKIISASDGDILVVGAGTPHKFLNTGSNRLDVICIHASPVFIQENLEETAG